MLLIRGVSRRVKEISSLLKFWFPKALQAVGRWVLFIGKFLDTNAVFEAKARHASFSSILSALGKLVKCQILGLG